MTSIEETEAMELLIGVPQTSRVVVSEEEASKGAKREREHPAAYAPCSHCGVMFLTGMTDTGEAVMLDTHQRTYVVLWLNNAPQPQLRASAAYPVHRCLPQHPAGKEPERRFPADVHPLPLPRPAPLVHRQQ